MSVLTLSVNQPKTNRENSTEAKRTGVQTQIFSPNHIPTASTTSIGILSPSNHLQKQEGPHPREILVQK